MNLEERRREIIEGSIIRMLVILSLPLLITQLIQVLYNLVDMFWLGRLSTAALSAPTPAWSVLVTLMSLNFAVTVPLSALVSQYVGKGDWKGAHGVISTGILLTLLLGLLSSIVLLPFVGVITSFLSSGHAVKEVHDYMVGLLMFMPFIFLSMTIASVLRSLGDMWKIATLYGLTVLFNLLLDPLLIFGYGVIPGMGTLGAAVATGISSTLASLIGLWILIRYGIKLRVELRLDVSRRILSMGAPIFVSYFLKGSGIMATVKLFSLFGTAAIAAYGIVQKVARFSAYIALGTGGATFTMVGQNLGNNNPTRAQRVLRTSVIATFSIMLLISTLLGVFGREVSSIFTSDEGVISISSQGLWVYAPTMPFLGIVFPVSNALNAAGQTFVSSIIGIGRFWILRIPIAYVLGEKLGSALGVFLGIGLANMITGLLSLYFLFNSRWLRRIV